MSERVESAEMERGRGGLGGEGGLTLFSSPFSVYALQLGYVMVDIRTKMKSALYLTKLCRHLPWYLTRWRIQTLS